MNTGNSWKCRINIRPVCVRVDFLKESHRHGRYRRSIVIQMDRSTERWSVHINSPATDYVTSSSCVTIEITDWRSITWWRRSGAYGDKGKSGGCSTSSGTCDSVTLS